MKDLIISILIVTTIISTSCAFKLNKDNLKLQKAARLTKAKLKADKDVIDGLGNIIKRLQVIIKRECF